MEKTYNSNREYVKYLLKESAGEIRGIFRDMYSFAKLAFSKNLMQKMEVIKRNRLENKIPFIWEK